MELEIISLNINNQIVKYFVYHFPIPHLSYSVYLWCVIFMHFILHFLNVGIFYTHLTILFTHEEKSYHSALLHVSIV